MQITLYHSTIKAKLKSIIDEKQGLKSGMSSLKRDLDGLYDYLGFYDDFSPNHIYAWTDFEYAKEAARELAIEACDKTYSEDERTPVVIEFSVDKGLVSSDSQSRGVMVLGNVDYRKLKVHVLEKPKFYKPSKKD